MFMVKTTFTKIGFKNLILILFTTLFYNSVLSQYHFTSNDAQYDKSFVSSQADCKVQFESFDVLSNFKFH